MTKVVLKPGKDKPIRNRHHWIFSGAIAHLPEFEDGACLPVESDKGAFLGWGYFNRRAKITGRMISFDTTSPLDTLHRRLQDAWLLRQTLFSDHSTTAYRLVNGEGDCLPGLVIDRYGDNLVIQISTLGMRSFRQEVVRWLIDHLKPQSIYEKSLLPSRKEEGLEDEQGGLYGPIPVQGAIIKENRLLFEVSILHGQKTGFFLDQRCMRQLVRGISKGKRVLNCFGYTGGFSVYAASGEALEVDTVDISTPALDMAKKNMALNGFDQLGRYNYYTADAFQFLRERPLDYQLVILDPPAFAKRQKDIVAACRGYKDINRLAMQKMPKQSLLLTCSCSYHVDENLFKTVIFQASVEAGRTARILGRHQLAEDHPLNICHPEGDYLKSLLLYLD